MKFESKIYEEGIYEEASVYDAWLKNSNERDLLKKYLQERIDTWATKSPLSVVEIGCFVTLGDVALSSLRLTLA